VLDLWAALCYNGTMNRNRAVWSACVAVALVVLFLAQCARASTAKESAEFIKAKYGVSVHYSADRDVYFSKYKQNPPYNAKCKKASRFAVLKIMKDIKKFLKMYKKHVISENLDGIFICDVLKFHGMRYAGTYIGNSIYVGRNSPYSHLHHEFSSILMFNGDFRFPWVTWRKLRRGVKDEKIDAYLNGTVQPYFRSKRLLKMGLYIAYAQTDLENDFNVTVMHYMTERAFMKRRVTGYPIMKAKYNIVDKMYKRILR